MRAALSATPAALTAAGRLPLHEPTTPRRSAGMSS